MFKPKFIILYLFIAYIIFCQSCLTFRTTYKQTKAFFDSNKVNYLDSSIQFENYTTHFIETGSKNKPTIVFIHGSPGSWDAFKHYLVDSALLQSFRLISLDRPGFGYSNFGKAQNLEKQTQIIAHFIQTIHNKQPIFVVGHSIGGAVVISLGCQKQLHINKIIVLAGAEDPKAEAPETWRAFLKTPPFRYLIPRVLSTANDELWWLKKDLYLLQPQLVHFKTNVLIIHGENDQLVPYKNVAYLQKELKHATSLSVISIPKENHFIPWTQFQLIQQELLKFALK